MSDALRSGRLVTATTLEMENQEHVAQLLVDDLQTSTRRVHLELDISHTSYRRIIKKLKFKSYAPRLTYGLLEDDPDRCLQYCESMLNEYGADPTIFNQILLSDETQFKVNGLVNQQNSVYYDTVNPHIHYETQLNQMGVLVWAGMSSFGMFGPYFFNRNCTRETYLHMLLNYLVPGLEATYEDNMTNGTLYF